MSEREEVKRRLTSPTEAERAEIMREVRGNWPKQFADRMRAFGLDLTLSSSGPERRELVAHLAGEEATRENGETVAAFLRDALEHALGHGYRRIVVRAADESELAAIGLDERRPG